jgi:DNA-binding LytR/AlgR family response regulator
VGKIVKLITVDEICYFQADNKYTLVVTPDVESLIQKTIKELSDELDPQIFWQIHRSTVVNVNAIASVERNVRGACRSSSRPETSRCGSRRVRSFVPQDVVPTKGGFHERRTQVK